MAKEPMVPGPKALAFPPNSPHAPGKLAGWLLVLLGLYFAVWGECQGFWQLGNQHVYGLTPVLIATGLVAPLALIGKGPLLAWRIQVVALALVGVVMPWSTDWPWSITGLVLVGAVGYLVAKRHRAWLLLGMWALTTLALLFAGRNLAPVVPIVLALAFAAVLTIGHLRGQAVTTKGQLDQARQALDAESAHAAVLAERGRIARDLHDVVAHRMSLIAIQAEAAPRRIKGLPPEATKALGLINDLARQALAETRSLVGLLRSDDDAAELAPAPTLANVANLVQDAQANGVSATLRVIGRERQLDAATALAGYRIAQEGLVNAVRHAPGQAITVVLDYSATALTVTVTNSPVSPDGSDPAVDAAPTAQPTTSEQDPS
jgi:signal transduction histidine kinase